MIWHFGALSNRSPQISPLILALKLHLSQISILIRYLCFVADIDLL